MRELISEATRTVEDSQTAQALHGLLSLKSPADCTPSATSSLLTSVGELSMELIQQASEAGLDEHQAAELHEVNTGAAKSPAKSAMQPVLPSASADRHATLRAAILSPGGTGLQPGAAGSAVQILLQMQQDDAATATRGKPARAKLASSASAGNISVVPASSTVGANTTHVLLDRSLPVKITAASAAPKAAAPVPLSSVVRVSNSSTSPAVPIQLIATSQGVLAIPQSYKLVPQNVAALAAGAAATVPASPARLTQPPVAAVVPPAKRRLSSPASSGGLLKVAKPQTAVTKSHAACDPSSTALHPEPTFVVANSLPHTVGEDVATRSTTNPSALPNHCLQTAIRDSYEKLFWKVYLQSSSFQSMPRPLDDAFNGSSEVSRGPECTPSSCG